MLKNQVYLMNNMFFLFKEYSENKDRHLVEIHDEYCLVL